MKRDSSGKLGPTDALLVTPPSSPGMRELDQTHSLPVIEDHLGEGLSCSRLAKLSGESERLVDGQVRLDGVHGGSRALLLGEDVSTLPVEGRVDTSESGLGALNLDLWRVQRA